MKSIPLLPFCIVILLTQCRQKEASNSGQQETASTTTSSLKAYEDSLARYLFTPERNRWVLELFANHFDKTNAEQADLALKAFLAYQSALIDTLNSDLYKHPDYEAINTLIYGEAKERKPEALAFEKQMNQNGLLVKSTEGTIYIDGDPEQLRTYFANYLTPSTKEFLKQFISEENQELSEDGGLLIAIIDLANRLIFWDEFSTKYPQHIFAQTVKDRRDAYLSFLLTGMDNTPAFDFENKKINKDFSDAYDLLLSKHADLPCAKVIKEYVELLKQNNYTQTKAVDQFVQQYSPYH